MQKKLDALRLFVPSAGRWTHLFCFCVCARAGTSPCLRGESGMGSSLAAVVRLSQRNEACCFIGQAKLLRQGFCWRFESCQSQMELHNMFNPWGYKEALYESIGGSAKKKRKTRCFGLANSLTSFGR